MIPLVWLRKEIDGIWFISPIPIAYHEQEWSHVELFFASFEEARSKLLSFGGAVKVIEPLALKCSILDYAEQIQKLYNS